MPRSNKMLDFRSHRRLSRAVAGLWCLLVALLFAEVPTLIAQDSAPTQSARTLARSTINFAEIASKPITPRAVTPRRAPTSPLAADSFPGLSDNGRFIPPDTHGAVGTNLLVAVGNGSMQIQTRSGAIVSSTTLANFWSSVFTNNNQDVFDPKILYDSTRDRFIFTTCYAGFDTNSAVLIGVTATGDPTGNWFLYRVQADPTGQLWADYPSIGFNRNWVVVTFNMFTIAGGSFVRSQIYIFDKANLMAGGATANNTLDASPNPQRFTLVPTVNMDPTPELYLIQNVAGTGGIGNSGTLALYRITGRVGAETVNLQGNIAVFGGWQDFPIVGNADFSPQLGLPIRIQANDSRMQNAVQRNGSIWCTHQVFLPAGGGTRMAVQWFQILPFGPGFVGQRGRIDDPTGQRFFGFPSIAVNRFNDVLIGYSTFGANQYAGAGYSYRRVTDPFGTMQPDQTLKLGEGPYFKDFGSGANRWGDYSMTMVDPLNDLDMWTIQEYAATPVGNPAIQDNGRWGTWWGRVAGPTTADGILELVVSPPAGSVLQGGKQISITVTVTDSVAVTNAVVRGTFGALTSVIFPNDGLVPDLVAGDNVYTLNVTVPNLVSNLVDLTLEVSAPGKLDATLTVTYLVQSPPPNDLFDNGIRISDGGGVVNGNNTFATYEGPGEPIHAGVVPATNSVWWYWSPTNTGLVLVDTLGTTFNNVVAVYAGNNVSNLVQLAASDDTATPVGLRRQPYVYFTATNAATYRIAVAGATPTDFGAISLRVEPDGIPDTNRPVVAITSPRSGLVTNNNSRSLSLYLTGTAADLGSGASGVAAVSVAVNQNLPVTAFTTNGWTNWFLTVALQPGTNVIRAVAVDNAQNVSAPATLVVNFLVYDPPNDLFSLAMPLTNPPPGVLVVLAPVNTANATAEAGEPNHAGKVGGKSIWFSIQPTTDGLLDVNTSGSTFDTLLGIYTGDRIFRASLVSSNDNAAPGVTFSHLSQPLWANVIYHIAVDGLDGASGFAQLNYSFTSNAVVSVGISNQPGGVVTPPGNLYLANTTTQFLAIADPGYDFVVWQEGGTPVTLAVSDFANLPSLAGKLNARLRAVDRFVVSNLTALTRTNLTNYLASPTDSLRAAALKDGLAVDLNRLILGPSIYSTQNFSTITLRSETRWELSQINPPGELLQHLNRLLLEDAYAAELVRQFTVESLENPLPLTLISNILLTPVFSPHIYSDDFESGNLLRLAWTNAGTPSWTVQSGVVGSGTYAARSGVIANGTNSSLVLTAAFRDGPGAFDYRVSTEPLSDFFSFLIDGVVQTNISGETGWQHYTFSLGAGSHRLEWRYRKDGSFAGSLDAVFLDNVELPLVVPITTASPGLLSRVDTTTGIPQLRIRGQTNQVYLIQASTDLLNWQTIGTNIAVQGMILFRDPEASMTYNARYYRVVTP